MGERLNEYGNPVSVHTCFACEDEFTVCPPVSSEEADGWSGCMAKNCPSYDPKRDADKLFDEEPQRIRREAINHG